MESNVKLNSKEGKQCNKTDNKTNTLKAWN